MSAQFEIDKQWFRSKDRKHLLAGSPLTSFTVSDAGARILDAIESSSDLGTGHEKLTSRLLATGAIHPTPTSPVATTDITVVIPAFATTTEEVERLQELVASLQHISVIVVDDYSPIRISLTHCQVLRNEENRGPSACRNRGLALVQTPFVAFVDSDAHADVHQLCLLAAVLLDESIVLVAPRIRTRNDNTGITEYESFHSPLDLGPVPAVVRPLSRVSYVPATVLVAHAKRLQEIGTFDEDLRLGEDVDLVWRACERGALVRYLPSIECHHDARTSWRKFIQQRFSYGRSAASLDHRHPYATSPLRAHVLMVILAASILSGYLYLGLLLTPLIFAYFILILRSTKTSIRQRVDVTRMGCLSTLRLLALAVRRAWWPVFVILSFFSVRATAMYTFALFTPLMFGILRNKPLAVGSYVALRIIDDLSYGAGVWVGAILQRSPRCLLPVLTVRRTKHH